MQKHVARALECVAGSMEDSDLNVSNSDLLSIFSDMCREIWLGVRPEHNSGLGVLHEVHMSRDKVSMVVCLEDVLDGSSILSSIVQVCLSVSEWIDDNDLLVGVYDVCILSQTSCLVLQYLEGWCVEYECHCCLDCDIKYFVRANINMKHRMTS